MTYEEAIKWLKEHHCPDDWECDCKDTNAMRLAVEALEKQIPKKPSGSFDDEIYGKTYVCECTGIINEYQKFCPRCGQAIDWGADEET